MAGEMRMSMILQANAGQALAEFRKLSQESSALSQGLAAVGAKAGQTAAPLNVLNTAAKSTGTTLDAAAANANRAVAPLAAVQKQTLSLANAMRAVAPAASTSASAMLQPTSASVGLNAASLDLNRSIGLASREMLESAQEAQAYRAALDQIRAQYNPLFAAQQQYEAQLERIAQAERLTATSADEAASARAAAAAGLANMTQPLGTATSSMSRYSHVVTNASFQVQDFAVQIASGQSAMIAFAQQAP